MEVLSARDLTVAADFGDGSATVLQNLNFSLAPGRVLGLVGESGAGKSMVGRTIAQLLPPGFAIRSGTLTFAGRDLVRTSAEQRRALLGTEIAFVPQEPLSALNPVLTIGRQIDEHLARLGAGRPRERRERAIALLHSVHLPDPSELLRKYPHQLSGGMCQRVLIAMAFASRPRLVIADEPTTALDVTIQARIVRLIGEMQERHGTAVIFITHDLGLAAQVCDDLIVLYAGRPVEAGPARAVFAAPLHPYTRCLQLANPSMTGPRRALYALPEHMPGLRAWKDVRGCAFAPRCPHAIDDCRTQTPPLTAASAARSVACIRASATSAISTPPVAAADSARSGAPVLLVQNLWKRFSAGGGLFRQLTDVVAVRDINFTLHENEFVGIVGESGSGKSTLARLLVGLERPSEGRIVIGGRDVSDDRAETAAYRRQHVQMIFQDPQSALNPRRRVASIATQPMEASGRTTWSERLERARALLQEMGLPAETAMRFPSQLSGGQRQRVNVARALCAVPKILVADEIVSGLDVSVQAQLLNLLLNLRRAHAFSMLFISHDLSVVRYLCDRVLVMYRGEVVESGPTEQVFSTPSHPYTRKLLAAVPPEDPSATWKPDIAEAEPAYA